MPSIPHASHGHLRKVLAVSALTLVVAFNLAACGEYVQHANLGRCTNLPSSGGALCEEIGGEYIFVDSLTRSMRRVSASQARFIGQADMVLASAQATNMAGTNGGQRNCRANPSIACSGALNNRMSGYRSAGMTSVCSGGQCVSMGR